MYNESAGFGIKYENVCSDFKMNDIVLNNAKFEGIRSGFVRCEKCNRTICRMGRYVKSFKLTFVCRCGEMGKAEFNSPKKKFVVGNMALMKENILVCPVCGEELCMFVPDSYMSMGFRIRCDCGAVYDKFKDYSLINKRLKEYQNTLK